MAAKALKPIEERDDYAAAVLNEFDKQTNDTIIIYHKDCLDGFGAALAAWKNYGDNADYIPAHYGDTPPDVTHKTVYILDFSYPRDVLIKMAKQANRIVILDHHQTAEHDIRSLINDRIIDGRFSTTESGAMMAWRYFQSSIPAPGLIEAIMDRDLWSFKLVQTRKITAALMTLSMDFKLWDLFLDDDHLDELIQDGSAILQYQNACIDKAIGKKVERVELAGYTVPCINCTHLISEIGNELAMGHPFAVLYFDTADERIFSLRSESNGVDVSEIAKQFGGGGHKHAAGFKLPKPSVLP